MSGKRKDALKKRLDENYAAFMESLQGKTPSELIAMAPEITAAQQLHEELPDVCNDGDAEYLLQFDDPLEAMRGLWADALTGGRTEEISHFMWEVRDRELMEVSVVVKQVSTDDLRHMEGQEGLVLQGCGGPPQEWVDGINDLLTEAGILLNASVFETESVSSFQHDGVTCLLFPFEGVELDVGRLAMWRLQTHGQFGGTWLSDYVPNRLGGFVHEPPRQKPTMSLTGMDGNIFAVMGKASSLLKEAGMGDLVSHMVQRVTTCGDYSKALNIISEYVETELSPPATPQKSNKKKVRNTHER